ncbi:MAG: PP2C family serine/threonine-protein phosphatase, partial [Leptotrichiaceae bacterium]
MRRKESEFKTIFFSESGTQKINNDYFGYVQLDNYAIWVIADGYDGEEGANIASKLSVESVIEYFTAHPRFNKEVIKELFKYTNDTIKQKQEEMERYSLMHTSLLIVISNYNKILYGNIGNTRLYHIQGGYIVNQSSDDSVSQLLVQERALDIKDIKSHRQRNDLLQAIGDYSKIKPTISNEIKLLEGDKICLTTRGIWENIDEHEIEVELSKFPERELWIDSIKRKVLGSSNKDIENNTFASICIDKVAPPIAEKKSNKWLKRIILISVVILMLILALLLWKLHKENKITKLAVSYVEKAEESTKIKNFDNANESLEMAIEEYKKIRPSSQGFLGILTNANNRRTKVNSKIELIEDKIVENKKLEEAFKSVSDGNSLFEINNFFESSKKYENAKYIFSSSSYMKDELNVD